MPRSAPQVMVPVRKQHEIARNELGIQAAHMAQPWLCWCGVTVLGLILRVGFVTALHLQILTIAAVLVLGTVVFALDLHLRQHHDTIPGKLIGPVTIMAVTGSLVVFLLTGDVKTLSLIYFTGGVACCACWDYWMRSAEHRDLGTAFIAAAEKAGIGGTRMTGLRRGPRRVSPGGPVMVPGGGPLAPPGNPRRVTARLKHEPGLVTTADVTDNLERLESGLGHPPGSWTVTPDNANAGYSRVSISDPQVLDAAPLPWPGPSRPGSSIAEPIRGGLWQDAEEMNYLLRDHHLLGMGATGSGKFSWMASQVGEAITRYDYACFAADITKRDQFIGALRPALHRAEIDPDGALDLLAAVPRMLDARADYLGANHLTEWREGCGLTFCDGWLEECADVIGLLDKRALKQWKMDVRRARSLGWRWDLSTQRSDFEEVPTLVRGQMGKMCFGVLDPKDAEFGLSAEQRKRGCRPQLWGTNIPGKCFIDALSIPEDRRAMPMRWWYWGPDSVQLAAYAAQWPASARPLDDVTGEALEAVPGPLASTAFPVSFPRAPAAPAGDDSYEEEENGGGLATVRQLRPAPRAASQRAPVPVQRPSEAQAMELVEAQIAAWAAEGRKFFIRRDWDPLLGVAQRTPSWLYNTIFPRLTMDGVLARHADGRLTRWEILAATREEGQ